MSSLESLLAAAEERFEALSREASEAEALARERRTEAEKAGAYADGLKAALAAVSSPRTRQRSSGEANSRTRELTAMWKAILRSVDRAAEGGRFNYDDLEHVASEEGHEIARDTLRSQMSLYKARGLVDASGAGLFQLTDEARKAVGALPPPVPSVKQPTPRRPGAFDDDLDDPDVPF